MDHDHQDTQSDYPPLFKVKIPSTKAKNQKPSKYIVFQILVQDAILYTYSYEIPHEQEELPDLSSLKPRTTEKGKYKNKGKANEETPAQNIHVQAQSRWNKKVDEGYSQERPDINTITNYWTNPMLAQDYRSVMESDRPMPELICWQPKLDGERCFTKIASDGTVSMQSRKQQEYKGLDHIHKPLVKLIKLIKELEPSICRIDGEFIIPGWREQDISRVTARARNGSKTMNENVGLLEYHIFDCADATMTLTFHERIMLLCQVFQTCEFDSKNGKRCPIRLVETHYEKYENSDQITTIRDEIEARGFEGIMIRFPDSPYRGNYRAPYLLKYKSMQDIDVVIVAGEEAEGTREGCPVFWVVDESLNCFKCVSTGTVDEQRENFNNLANLIGTVATVQFQDANNSGKVKFGVITRFREAGDKSKEDVVGDADLTPFY